MHPVKMAVHDLLVRIYGAHHSACVENTGKSSDSSTRQTGNCFLVYGSRGTGKTTVLLNAQRAVSRKFGEEFFAQSEISDAKTQAIENAEKLRKDGIVWLEILNLEPIPSEANLLTILLTQVRNALHSHSDKRQRDQRSIFEEEANSAQQLLNKLINDTTLMWQNITEPDTRNISARQVKAADIYAGFPEKFKKAMDKLIEELSETHGKDTRVSIVLPIDNIDRSTEHLQSIVKLAQLVSHPNLWLVMSGDRVEVETFLERAYWKELIRSNVGASERGKINSEGEDEALVIARRQANATAQKLWPANHRVEIDFLTSKETLKFEYKQNPTDTSNSIRKLLEEIKIPMKNEQRDKQEISNKQKISNINLFKLFYVEKEITGEITDEIVHKYLTRAAHHGLSLPARSVLDLWQLLDWLVYDMSSGSDFRAEKVARTMLRNAISSSDMPNAMAQDLQTYILRRGEKHGTILYFEDNTLLNVIPLTSANNDFEYTLTPVFSKVTDLRSRLEVCNIEDIILELRFGPSITQSDSSKNQYPQPFVTEYALDNEKRRIELPPLVAAWLMVLYDILILAEATASSWVIGSTKLDDNYPNVSVNHSVIQTEKCKNAKPLYWIPPAWGLFLGRNIFSLHWQNFREDILSDKLKDRDLVTRLLAAGWILCVLKTSVELIASIEDRFNLKKDNESFDNNSRLQKEVQEFKVNLSRISQDFRLNIDASMFEEGVMQAAGRFYTLIQYAKSYQLTQEQKDNKENKIIPAAYVIMLETGKWLETEFISFLSYAYVPIESVASKERFNSIWKILSKKEDLLTKDALTDHWKNNSIFILAEIDEKFAETEDTDNGNTEIVKETTTETIQIDPNKNIIRETIRETKKTIAPLGKLLFADLYDKIENPKPASKL